jgi:DNA-binding response OmpR family regulator
MLYARLGEIFMHVEPHARGESSPVPASVATNEIAIIDDDELFLTTFAANLTTHGYRVATFRNARTALDRLLVMPDLKACLVDWRMPQMDGPAVIEALRHAGFAVPIMVVTSSLHPKTRAEAISHGATACVEKTQGFQTIVKRIDELVAGVADRDDARPALDPLQIDREQKRVRWRGRDVALTGDEFQTLLLLTDLADMHVAHGELYWAMQHGSPRRQEEGYRMLVRRMMECLRRKFIAADPQFDALEHRAGQGYRWRLRR